MADREQPYDPYIPAGGNAQAGAQGQSGNHRTAALQAVRPSRVSFSTRATLLRLALRTELDSRER